MRVSTSGAEFVGAGDGVSTDVAWFVGHVLIVSWFFVFVFVFCEFVFGVLAGFV